MLQKNLKTKVGRNDLCPCGSGLKYKKCCLPKESTSDNKRPDNIKNLYLKRYQIRLKENPDIEGIKKAGLLAVATLDMIEAEIRPGITTEKINTLVHDFTIDNGGIPAPLNYRGFPKSVCVSVNNVICHGIPGEYILKDGDIVNVDVTPVLKGYYADTNKTFFAGTPGPDAKKIVSVARESLKQGLSMIRPGNTVGDIGWAIQKYAEGEGCSVVREFVGHGVGFDFHEPPQVPHYGRKGEGIALVPGMVFTVEPMINLGKSHLKILEDDWTAVTSDGSLSAQFEQTILVTENGYESLTPFEL
ncbi:MAG TPA: type I methionyl aminopeptidase [Desulfobacteraceae bacterium]|nr:type I methionyl aminopeptidase [Desulfobacteraceae bacterium]HPJ68009.1 type I methionyl aminopeptidase [Desulfobacteraceae bacterium]